MLDEYIELFRSTSKFKFPNMTKEQMEHWNPQEIEKYGSFIKENKKLITSEDDVNQITIVAKDIPQHAYIAMLSIPESQNPRAVLKLYETASKLKIPAEYMAGITLTAAKASIEVEMHESFYNSLSELISADTQAYAVPFLFLSATLCKPASEEYPLSPSLRLSCIQTYYTAINKLMLGDAVKAESYLLRALSICSKCKEIIPSVLNYLGLVQFLNKKSFAVFQSSVPDKHSISDEVRELYDIDLEKYNPGETFLPWKDHILKERARRIIFDVACTYSKYKLEELKEKCQCPEFDEALALVVSEVYSEIHDEWIYFDVPTHNVSIEKQINSVQNELFTMLKIE
jgi:hypothetical protein